MEETQRDIANKIEDQNGAAYLKDNKVFLSDITKTNDTLIKKIFYFYNYDLTCFVEWFYTIRIHHMAPKYLISIFN